MAQSGSVSAAALAAMRPAEVGDSLKERAAGGEGLRRGDSPASPTLVNLSKAAGITLRLIIMRAQNPLYLTAGNFANITLELYLTVRRTKKNRANRVIPNIVMDVIGKGGGGRKTKEFPWKCVQQERVQEKSLDLPPCKSQ